VTETLARRLERLDPWRLMLLLVVAALMSLLPAWLNYDIISIDGALQYIPPARLFAAGDFVGGFNYPQPLFPILIALVARLTGFGFELSGRLVAVVSFVLAVLALYEITFKLSRARLTALLAAALLMLNAELVARSVDCLKESLLLALVLWGNYLLLRRNWLERTAGLVLIAAGFLVRPTALFFILGWLAVWVWRDPAQRRRRCGLVLAPLAAFTALVFLNQDYAPFRKKGIAFALLIEHALALKPANLAVAFKVPITFLATGAYLPVIAGLWGYRELKSPAWRINLKVVLLLALIILILMGWLSNRYLLLPLAWFYPAAAAGILVWLQASRKAVKVLAVLTLIILPLVWGHAAFKQPEPERLDEKRAGLWLKSEFGAGQAVYSNRPRVIFYAEAAPANQPDHVVAIDAALPDAAIVVAEFKAAGRAPVKAFGSIQIYRPRRATELRAEPLTP